MVTASRGDKKELIISAARSFTGADMDVHEDKSVQQALLCCMRA